MKNKSSIFIVNGIYFQGSQVLGAYSTMAAAESALEVYKVKLATDTDDCWEFDDYGISEHVLDAAAKP